MSTTTAARTSTNRINPAVLAPVLAFAGFTIAYVATNAGVPHPDASGADVLAYTTSHTDLINAGAVLMLLSATPLAIAGALLQRTLRAPAIAVVGAGLAAAALTLSALFAWAGGHLAGSSTPELARTIADMGYLTGGPAYSAGFGLLIIGISIPALLNRALPPVLVWIGFAIAAAAALSTLALIASGFGYLLPVVRFGGLLWLIATGVVLSRR
ncbi:DUF4386 domain-containing protein [Nocardia sp. NPDC006630]|uniref:DUF4386 domain-containing protein n=1 Tax=Nocardia sp. NPDC006630 TaxID=3157181 RepID=UPI0033B7E6AE